MLKPAGALTVKVPPGFATCGPSSRATASRIASTSSWSGGPGLLEPDSASGFPGIISGLGMKFFEGDYPCRYCLRPEPSTSRPGLPSSPRKANLPTASSWTPPLGWRPSSSRGKRTLGSGRWPLWRPRGSITSPCSGASGGPVALPFPSPCSTPAGTGICA